MLALGLAGAVIIVASCTGRLLAIGLIHAGSLLAAVARDERRGAAARHRRPVPASTPLPVPHLAAVRRTTPVARRSLVRSAA